MPTSMTSSIYTWVELHWPGGLQIGRGKAYDSRRYTAATGLKPYNFHRTALGDVLMFTSAPIRSYRVSNSVRYLRLRGMS